MHYSKGLHTLHSLCKGSPTIIKGHQNKKKHISTITYQLMMKVNYVGMIYILSFHSLWLRKLFVTVFSPFLLLCSLG